MIRKAEQSKRTEIMGRTIFNWVALKVSLERRCLNTNLDGVREEPGVLRSSKSKAPR